MKRFIVSILCISTFFISLGSLLEKVGAKFKSDEKALEIVRKARVAIGGDAAISSVKSMIILGKTTKTFDIEGAARTDTGDSEINFELPNKLSKKLQIGAGEGENQIVDKQVNVIMLQKGDGGDVQFKTEGGTNDAIKNVIIKKQDGSTEEIKTDGSQPIIIKKGDGKTAVTDDGANIEKRVILRRADSPEGGENIRSNELFRTTFSLLLSAPEGLDVSYTYAGEGAVDGISCDIIAANDGVSTVNLYLDKSTNLPRMMTFRGYKPFIVKINKDDAKAETNFRVKVMTPENAAPELADFQVKFADYRSVGGLQLPFKWTQTVGGKDDESTDITSYELNPANIADKFKEMPTKVFMRTKQ